MNIASFVTRLDLRSKNLREFPSCFWDCENLTSMFLGDNRLIYLPEELVGLSRLSEIDACSNRMMFFPPVLCRLPALEIVRLDRCDIGRIPGRFHPKRLRHLSIAENRIESLDELCLPAFSALSTLNLRLNRLRSLPVDIGKLASLEELDLSENRLEALPAEITRLSRLKVLRIQGNSLEALPESIGALTSLQHLHIGGNHLEELPASIGRLHALESLSAENNLLVTLPSSIGGLRNLRSLDISGNRISSLPKEFAHLSALRSCNAAQNHLKDLPSGDNAGGLPSLEYMSILENAFSGDWWPPAIYLRAVTTVFPRESGESAASL
jgi:Leucine-rich repeat (LRR) protein